MSESANICTKSNSQGIEADVERVWDQHIPIARRRKRQAGDSKMTSTARTGSAAETLRIQASQVTDHGWKRAANGTSGWCVDGMGWDESMACNRCSYM